MPVSPSRRPHAVRLSARLSAQPLRALSSASPPPCPRPPGWAGRNAAPPPPRSAGYIGERSETEDARAEWRGWRRGWGAAVAPIYRETSGAEWGYDGVVDMVGGKSGGSTTLLPFLGRLHSVPPAQARERGHYPLADTPLLLCGYAVQM